jgi:hypothetical protein
MLFVTLLPAPPVAIQMTVGTPIGNNLREAGTQLVE